MPHHAQHIAVEAHLYISITHNFFTVPCEPSPSSHFLNFRIGLTTHWRHKGSGASISSSDRGATRGRRTVVSAETNSTAVSNIEVVVKWSTAVFPTTPPSRIAILQTRLSFQSLPSLSRFSGDRKRDLRGTLLAYFKSSEIGYILSRSETNYTASAILPKQVLTVG